MVSERFSKMVSIRMSKEGRQTLRSLASLTGKSQRWVIEDALRKLWEELTDPCAPREDKSQAEDKAARPTR